MSETFSIIENSEWKLQVQRESAKSS